jgi:WXG100 family type VII secretion target
MSASGTQLWDYGQLQSLVGVLAKVSGEIAQNKAGLERDTAAVRSGEAWTGAAQTAWVELQASYDQLTLHFSQVMQTFGSNVGEAQNIAATTDRGIAGTF